MSKINKLEYLHNEIMIAAEQLIVLTDKIHEAENHVEMMVLSNLSNGIAKKLSRCNQKIGIIFKL